jgi:hypothetical protein
VSLSNTSIIIGGDWNVVQDFSFGGDWNVVQDFSFGGDWNVVQDFSFGGLFSTINLGISFSHSQK